MIFAKCFKFARKCGFWYCYRKVSCSYLKPHFLALQLINHNFCIIYQFPYKHINVDDLKRNVCTKIVPFYYSLVLQQNQLLESLRHEAN